MRTPLHPWELRDPELTLTAIGGRMPFTIDTTVIALIDVESQAVADVRLVWSGHPPADHHALSRLLRDHALAMSPGRRPRSSGWSEPTHVFVTVVCRRGRVIDTATEHAWLTAWRYSNHLTEAFDGDVYVVTPHGWTGVMDGRAGFEPRVLSGDSSA